MRRTQGIKHWMMLGIIPALAIAVAARQLYLSTTDDLSTWKGGGMGMFAGSEATTRYAKIYLVRPEGGRQPLLRLTDAQEKLKTQFLNYPNERNVRALAQSIQDTMWWASTAKVPMNVFDQNGQKVQDGTEQLYDLYAMRSKPRVDSPDWSVEVDYWKANYDPATQTYEGNLVKTFKVSPRVKTPKVETKFETFEVED